MTTSAGPTIRSTTTHISDHDRLTIFFLAKCQLSRLFATHLGVTPGRYVRRARTEAAARLLASTSLSVSEVAQECGFGTAETLRQAFIQRFGVSPSRYRDAYASAEERDGAELRT